MWKLVLLINNKKKAKIQHFQACIRASITTCIPDFIPACILGSIKLNPAFRLMLHLAFALLESSQDSSFQSSQCFRSRNFQDPTRLELKNNFLFTDYPIIMIRNLPGNPTRKQKVNIAVLDDINFQYYLDISF